MKPAPMWRALGIAGGIAAGLLGLMASSPAVTHGRSMTEGPALGASLPARAQAWFDVLDSQGGSLDLSRRPIAGRYFGPGYEDFDGVIAFEGQDFGAKGPFDFGNGDLALLRKGPRPLPQVGSTATFPALIAAVSWRSTQPIEVRSPRGVERFDVEISLSRMATPPHGTMTVDRETAEGGTLSLEVDALLRFRFFQAGGREVVVDMGAPDTSFGRWHFKASGIAWSSRCSGSTLEVPRLSGGICLGQTARGEVPVWRLESASVRVDLNAAVRSEVRVAPRIAPGAGVARGTQLADGVKVEAGAQVLAAGLGRNVQVGAGATVGKDALVGLDSRILAGAYVGPGSYLGEKVVVGRRARLERDVVLHTGTRVADQAILASGVSVGGGTEIGRGAIVNRGVKIGAGSHIGEGAWIKSGVSLAPGTTVPPATTVTGNTITCLLPGGSTASMTASQCTASGGAVRGYLPSPQDRDADADLSRSSFAVQDKQIVQGQVQGQQLGQLNRDIDASGVAPGNGGPPWSPEHDCDDFADELERFLEGRGWNATLTVYWDLNPEYAWYTLFTDKWINGHALTDVHLADGSYVWIEAQRTSRGGAVGVDLDSNDDGTVGVGTSPTNGTTEGNRRIEVYGSRAEAERAGHRLD